MPSTPLQLPSANWLDRSRLDDVWVLRLDDRAMSTSVLAEHLDETAAVRDALADAYAKQGDDELSVHHRAAAKFYRRCAQEQRMAELGATEEEKAA